MSEEIFIGAITGSFPHDFDDMSVLISNKYIQWRAEEHDCTVYNVLKDFSIGSQEYPEGITLNVHGPI